MHDLYEQCLCIARITGKEYGYAIGFHGTGLRDLDLIAVPWTEHACSPEDLVKTLAGRIEGELKRGVLVEGKPVLGAWPKPGLKPHGRVAYTILLGGPYWIDISVMPRYNQLIDYEETLLRIGKLLGTCDFDGIDSSNYSKVRDSFELTRITLDAWDKWNY